MRCFVAIELSEPVRQALKGIQDSLADHVRGVRWTLSEQIHLTVKFLGEVADGQVREICKAIRTVAAGCPPFALSVAGLGCFPPRGPARIVWAGLPDLPAELLDCQQRCEEACAALGFAPENRPFHPHLTLGRVKSPQAGWEIRRAIEAQPDFDGGHLQAGELVVFQSVLQPSGPVYTPVTRAPLAG